MLFDCYMSISCFVFFTVNVSGKLSNPMAPADDRDDMLSVASSRRGRRYVSPLEDVDLPGGATIAPDSERLGRGPAYRANLPVGLMTRSGESTRFRSYRSEADALGANRTPAHAIAQLTAWLNSTYRDGWVAKFEAPKARPRKPKDAKR